MVVGRREHDSAHFRGEDKCGNERCGSLPWLTFIASTPVCGWHDVMILVSRLARAVLPLSDADGSKKWALCWVLVFSHVLSACMAPPEEDSWRGAISLMRKLRLRCQKTYPRSHSQKMAPKAWPDS